MNKSRLVVFLSGSFYWASAIFLIMYFLVFLVRLIGYFYQGRMGEFDMLFQLISVAEKTWVGIPAGLFVWTYAFFDSGKHKG